MDVYIFSCASLLKRPICTYSSSHKKRFSFKPIINASLLSLIITKRQCRCLTTQYITITFHDQAHNFDLLLLRGSCCGVFFVLFFCYTKPRKKLELDLTQVNKTDKASFSYFLAIYHQYFQRSRSLCDVSFTKPLCMEKSSSSSLDFTTYFTVFHHPYINIAYSYFW